MSSYLFKKATDSKGKTLTSTEHQALAGLSRDPLPSLGWFGTKSNKVALQPLTQLSESAGRHQPEGEKAKGGCVQASLMEVCGWIIPSDFA